MNLLERLMGPPMAAPETPAMRRWRIVFIALLSITAMGTAGVQLLVALIGRAAAGAMLAITILTTVCVGLFYFIRKVRIDDLWLVFRGFDKSGDGA